MRFRFHKYEWSKPWTSVRHNWSFIGKEGAINFHCSETGPDVNAGLETHYTVPPEYMKDHAPHHLDCPLTGGRCWHDGTSLYASEHLWPIIKPMLRSGDHETIFQVLENEYDRRFGVEKDED